MNFLRITVLVILCAACSAKHNEPASSEPKKLPSDAAVNPLIISEISENPSGKYPRYKALMEDLSENVNLSGYDGTAVRIYPDFQQLLKAVREGDAQLILEGTFSTICVASRLEGGTLLINAKDGRVLFQSYFVVPDSSPLNSVENLTGKVLALEDSESTSGYFAALVALRRRGMVYNKSEIPVDNAVNVYLAGEDELILRDLFAGKADCGIVPDYEWDELEPDVKERLKIIFKSDPMPRSLLLLSSELNASDREGLSSYFIAMREDPGKKTVLEKLKSGGFYRIDEAYDPALLDELKGYCDELVW